MRPRIWVPTVDEALGWDTRHTRELVDYLRGKPVEYRRHWINNLRLAVGEEQLSGAAVTFVAERAKATQAAAASFGITVAGLTTGNLMLVCIAIGAGGTSYVSTSDNGAGSTWQTDFTHASVAGTTEGFAVASAIVGATPPTTITVNFNNASSTSGYKVVEFSGTASAAWFDVGANTTLASGSTALTYPTIAPAVAGELIIAMAGVAPLQASYTAGGSYTAEGTPVGTAPEPILIYRLSGTVSESPTATLNSATTVTTSLGTGAYKAAATALQHLLTATGAGN